MVLGEVENSVIFPGVRIGKGAKVKNSVIMPYTTVGENAVVDYAIVAQNCEIAAAARPEDGSSRRALRHRWRPARRASRDGFLPAEGLAC